MHRLVPLSAEPPRGDALAAFAIPADAAATERRDRDDPDPDPDGERHDEPKRVGTLERSAGLRWVIHSGGVIKSKPLAASSNSPLPFRGFPQSRNLPIGRDFGARGLTTEGTEGTKDF
jgi:hypothetical protein